LHLAGSLYNIYPTLSLAHTNIVPTSRLPTTQSDSLVYVVTPVYGQANMQNMNTLYGTVLRTSSPRIQNYADSDGETE